MWIMPIFDWHRRNDGDRFGNLALIHDGTPAEGEESIPDDHDVLVCGELARHSFHREVARSRDKAGVICIVSILEHRGKLLHVLGEWGCHQVHGIPCKAFLVGPCQPTILKGPACWPGKREQVLDVMLMQCTSPMKDDECQRPTSWITELASTGDYKTLCGTK